ncbi:GNAT family N-acetyltransferase [Streptomyces aquilus]|uniref:GNAT family N-acetyltransferase n=1 Tax=Streptomyces aquilus TaxID=2548456 RepID=UPI0010D9BEE1|nr:GNAT family N-acetyltransferase [Streptomyces aquilus]
MTAVPSRRTSRRLRIRHVREEDLQELSLLDRESFPEEPYPYFVLRQMFDVYPDHLLVLDDGTALMGYVLCGTAPDLSRSWVLGLGITPDERGQGFGRLLMEEALRRLRGLGVREVVLTVAPANKTAILLYENLGFVGEPTLHENYFGPGADRLLMRLRLSRPGFG